MTDARAAVLGAVALCLAGGAGLAAHEIGTTRVSAAFDRQQTYSIEVATDAASLVDKLAASGDAMRPQPAPKDPAQLQARIGALEAIFRRKVNVQFDGSRVEPSIEYAVVPPPDAMSVALVKIRLTGPIPRGARQFTWTYGWTFASYALTVSRAADTQPATQWLEGGQQSQPLLLSDRAGELTRTQIALRYLALGFTHIVPKGLDHMLFVIGVFLLTRRVRAVLWQVSAFTIAHSITLALSMYGVLSVAPAVVEPLIALSIAYVAIENLCLAELKPWRVGLVFAFGLLHGMGFAGALKELGLPPSEFITALLTFNLGVEAGQLTVIAVAFLAVGWYCGRRAWYRQVVVVPASALIACVALFWTIQRLGR